MTTPAVDSDVEVQPEPEVDTALAASQLRSLLATLVPPDRVHLVDAFGGSYTVPGILPARAQIVVMQKIEKLLEIDTDANALAGFSSGGMAAIGGAIIRLAAKPEVLLALALAFEAAHPVITKEARKRGVDKGALEKGGSYDAADLFPVEEMVAGLVPFFLRLASRMVDLLAAMGDQAETAEA